MICDYDHMVFSSSEIMLPFLQGLNDSKKFPIVDVIVLFCQGEGSRMIGAGMKIPIGVFLHEYSPRGGEGGISHYKEGFGSVWHLDYRGGEECFLEFDECIILFLSPQKGSPFLGQVMEQSGECREVGDELLVKVTESDGGSDCFYGSGGLPLLHGLEFGRVHEHLSILDY